MNKPNYNILTPFKRWTIQNFPFIEEDFDAITNYQLLCKIIEYLNKVIENEKLLEQSNNELIDAFNNLKDYVDNYFENLDVQDEINNKLDEMVEQGTLQEIIASYIQSNVAWTFDTVASMKAATNLVDGSYAKTLGYYSVNDGGGALYKITDDNSNTSNYYENLGDGLYAMLITNKNTINVKQFGAVADGITDDSTAIQTAINYIKANVVEFTTDSNWLETTYMTLEFTPEKYYVDTTIDIDFPRNAYIDGKGCFIFSKANTICFNASSMMCHRALIKNINFCSNYLAFKFNLTKKDCSSILFEECRFMDCTTAIEMTNESTMTTFHKCHFLHCPTIYKTTSSDQTLFDDCWFSEYEHTENDATSFILNFGETIFKNCFFIPNGNYKQIDQSQYTGLAWIEMNDNTKISVDNCRISSETNNKTLVNFKGTFDLLKPNNSGITIRNCTNLSADNSCLIKLYSMPNFININDCGIVTRYTNFIDLDETFDFDEWYESLSTANAPLRLFYACKISLRNISTQLVYPYDNFPQKLIPFVRECDFPLYKNFNYATPQGKICIGYISTGGSLFTKESYIFEFMAHNQSNANTFTKYIGIVTMCVQTTSSGTFATLQVDPISINKSVDEEVSVTATFESSETSTVKLGTGNFPENIILTYNGTVLDSQIKNLFAYKKLDI